jgi:hypothetical protein
VEERRRSRESGGGCERRGESLAGVYRRAASEAQGPGIGEMVSESVDGDLNSAIFIFILAISLCCADGGEEMAKA